ncbi:Uncharacterised protein [[Clostridium] sordellii]|uniref:hypothetical protein n=1 Tax=Paraclostridium sordellii TaxID=1505 RepID=UPI0005E7FF86|nr:hypothetical protein [Paeniclostridium sordellii]CEQ01706.1 Uncharacterised protein [[Clostridium] sordellii] [Paeniclostridium sordellii]
MRVRLTDRDKNILSFLDNHSLITSSQIQRIFNMSTTIQHQRLNKLIECIPNLKKVRYDPMENIFVNNRHTDLLKNENYYYLNRKPKNIIHEILINEFYIKLLEQSKIFNFEILEFNCKYLIEVDDFRVKPDVYILIKYQDVEYEYLLELENNKYFNCDKYYALEQRGYILPTIIICTDRKVKFYLKNTEYIRIKLCMSNLMNFIKDFLDQTNGFIELSPEKQEEILRLNQISPCKCDTELF